ncbi:DUF6011 domain-containing protein [Rhodococcus koreensis]
MSTTTAREASAKQIYWIKKLAAQKGIDMLDGHDYERAFDILGETDKFVSSMEASSVLDKMFAAPYLKVEDDVNEPGMYRVGDTIFRVQESETGNLYAKRLVVEVNKKTGKKTGTLVYDAGAIREIRNLHRMTKEQAIECGKDYGICIVCGAQLEDPKSVARGIGPTCAKRV